MVRIQDMNRIHGSAAYAGIPQARRQMAQAPAPGAPVTVPVAAEPAVVATQPVLMGIVSLTPILAMAALAGGSILSFANMSKKNTKTSNWALGILGAGLGGGAAVELARTLGIGNLA